MIFISASAPHVADIPADATLTLATRPERLARDLVTFRRLAAGLQTCRTTMEGNRGSFSYDQGAPCRGRLFWAAIPEPPRLEKWIPDHVRDDDFRPSG